VTSGILLFARTISDLPNTYEEWLRETATLKCADHLILSASAALTERASGT
jgi:hypothetical protein